MMRILIWMVIQRMMSKYYRVLVGLKLREQLTQIKVFISPIHNFDFKQKREYHIDPIFCLFNYQIVL